MMDEPNLKQFLGKIKKREEEEGRKRVKSPKMSNWTTMSPFPHIKDRN